MFGTLLESRPIKKRSTASTAFSIAFHGVLIGAVAMAGAQASDEFEKAKAEKVEFVKPKEAPKTEAPPEQPKAAEAAPPPPKGFQVLQAPINIPDAIPAIDVTRAITDERDFTGKGIEGGINRGSGSAGAQVAEETAVLFNFAVDKPAMYASGDAPKYPAMLNNAGVEGDVLAQFEVDTAGRAVMTSFKALASANALFTEAVKAALPKLKYFPAQVGDKKVRVLVQQTFSFKKETK